MFIILKIVISILATLIMACGIMLCYVGLEPSRGWKDDVFRSMLWSFSFWCLAAIFAVTWTTAA